MGTTARSWLELDLDRTERRVPDSRDHAHYRTRIGP